MVDLKRKRSELVLQFLNKGSVPAADLGDLFSALAKDYSRLNKGRTLVVADLKIGSIIATLHDAYATLAPILPYAKNTVEVISAANALWKFFETFHKLIQKAKKHRGDLFRKKKYPGVRSAEKVIDITIRGGGDFKLRVKGKRIRSFRVTWKEAKLIRERAKNRSRR